jgi:Tfp pilus assembly major pilin PilA
MAFAASATSGAFCARPAQRGVTLIGLLFWAIIIACVALVGLKVLPTVNEYFTKIGRAHV